MEAAAVIIKVLCKCASFHRWGCRSRACTHLLSQVTQEAAADLCSQLLLSASWLREVRLPASCFYSSFSNPHILLLTSHMVSGKGQPHFSTRPASSLPPSLTPIAPTPPSRTCRGVEGGAACWVDGVKDQFGGIWIFWLILVNLSTPTFSKETCWSCFRAMWDAAFTCCSLFPHPVEPPVNNGQTLKPLWKFQNISPCRNIVSSYKGSFHIKSADSEKSSHLTLSFSWFFVYKNFCIFNEAMQNAIFITIELQALEVHGSELK